MVRVCFVCLGNICRSPTAEGVMRHLIAERQVGHLVQVDSAGTSAYHIGERPDRRSAATARRRGIELVGHARQFEREDLEAFDYVVAMDTQNFKELVKLAPRDARDRIHLMRDFDPESPKGASVPDPYYGGEQGFEEVLDQCLRACSALLDEILNRRAGE